MRWSCIALAVFVFLAAAQSQGYNKSLSVALSLENTTCAEPVQFDSGILEAAKLETFKIDIKNSGEEPIKNLKLFALMPKEMKYNSSSYLGGSDLEVSLEPQMFDEMKDTRIEWNIGILEANDIRSILLTTHIRCQEKNAQMQFAAFGDTSDRPVEDTEDKSFDLGICNCSRELTRSPLIIGGISLNDTRCDERVRFSPDKTEAVRLETFKLDVKNIGEKSISDLIVLAIMPKGMKYVNSSYSERSEGELEVIITPQEFDEAQNTRIEWIVGDLHANELRSILLNSYLKCPVNRTNLELVALGNVEGSPANDTWNESIELGNCSCTNLPTIDIETSLRIDASLNDKKCGDWEQFSPGKTEAARLDTFKVDVQNVGEKSISNLIVLAFMPKGMKYVSSSYYEANEGEPEVIVNPQEFNEAQNTRFEWIVGDLHANESRSILLNSYLKCPVNRTNIELVALGNVEGRPANDTWSESIDLGNCDCTGGNIDINLQVYEVNNNTTANFGKGCLEPAKLDLYNISVTNNGDVSLSNVKVIAEMNKGMMYGNSSYSDSWRGKLNFAQNPDVFNENVKTKLIWNIRDLLPRESKSIFFTAFLNRNVTDKDIFAMAQAYSPYSPENEPIMDFADIASEACEIRSDSGGPCTQDQIKWGICTKKVCPDWTTNFDLAMLMPSQEVSGGNNSTMKVCQPANASLLHANITATGANTAAICANASANNSIVTFSL